jgi:hypothetical protein
MIDAESSDREARRLAALSRYAILDTPRETAFDEIAALAAEVCGAPIGVVNLIGEGRQFFKAEVGLGVRETPLETSFCAKAILEDDFLLVPDATLDARFDCNPLVTGEPGLRFYAGALLKTPDGLPIGAQDDIPDPATHASGVGPPGDEPAGPAPGPAPARRGRAPVPHAVRFDGRGVLHNRVL